MLLVKPSFEFIGVPPGPSMLRDIEVAGRTCYKSQDKITDDSANDFCRKLIARGHEAMLEHASFSVRFVFDRGVGNEWCRHRLLALAQESTRFVTYKGGVAFVIPPVVAIQPGEYSSLPAGCDPTSADADWFESCLFSETKYLSLLSKGWPAQLARDVLTLSTKTELVVTVNVREWRHIFGLRCDKPAHPQMREVMLPLLAECKRLVPVLFDDLVFEEAIAT